MGRGAICSSTAPRARAGRGPLFPSNAVGVNTERMLPPSFHPAVARWFETRFPEGPSEVQSRGWAEIQAGRNTLIAAPTGSGKTLAAFLAAIDELVRRGLEGGLTDETHVVYVSPLKALSNDIHRNLEAPLAGIREELKRR